MKKVIFIALILSVVFCFGCGTKEEAPPTYFEFTADEFVSKLEEDWSIDLVQDFVSYDEESGEKIASYKFSTTNDTKMTAMSYSIFYDSITNKVSYISFDVNKDFMGNVKNALTRFYFHIGAVAEIIDPGVNVDGICDNIKAAFDDGEDIFFYESDKYNILVNSSEYSFSASFHSK